MVKLCGGVVEEILVISVLVGRKAKSLLNLMGSAVIFERIIFVAKVKLLCYLSINL